jgi:pimeloyl-ACP methyl ester carboxylesterase
MGCHAFSLMDEAQAVVDLIDLHSARVHLVGHSYGGGVALKVASERPAQVASLTLYEPSAFHLLRQLGQSVSAELTEIEQLAATVGNGLVTGAYQQAAANFVDYWNGSGSWASLRPRVRDSLVTWLPKAPLDFNALLNDNTPKSKLTSISCPVLLLRGGRSPAPSRRLVDELAGLLPNAKVGIVADAGHMGPLTHTSRVNDFISMHVRRASDFGSPQNQIAELAA